MDALERSKARQIAEAAACYEKERTGHAPQSVTVVMSGGTLVVTLHGALSPSEQALAVSPVGASELQEYRRRLFETSAAEFRLKIKEITGVEVCAVADEIEPKSGAAVTVFSSGTVVQVFMLAGGVATESWSGKTTGTAA